MTSSQKRMLQGLHFQKDQHSMVSSIIIKDPEQYSLNLSDFRPKTVKHDLSAFRIGDTIVFKDKQGNLYEARAMRRGSYAFPITSGWQLEFLRCCIDLGVVSKEVYDRVNHHVNSRQIDDEIRWAEKSIEDSTKLIKELKMKKKAIIKN